MRPSFRKALSPFEGAPGSEGLIHRSGAPEGHARWIFDHSDRIRAVLDLKEGFGGHPRGLFPLYRRFQDKEGNSLRFWELMFELDGRMQKVQKENDKEVQDLIMLLARRAGVL